jgi:hypothetical protein
MLRSDDAVAFLLALLETAREPLARQALEALAAHIPSPSVAERIRATRRPPDALADELTHFGRAIVT